MGRKRRAVELGDGSRWIFNRMADVYGERPAYPTALLDRLCEAAPGRRVLDLGAGTGHLALPLAQRGFDVVAVEPAAAMLDVLAHTAQRLGIPVTSVHSTAEHLPSDLVAFDLALISDAIHFLDSELVGRQLGHVLVPRACLAVVTCDFAETDFMRSVSALLTQTTGRRPRSTDQAIRQMATLARCSLVERVEFCDETPVTHDKLECILKSVSFVGPAMNAARFEALRLQLHALPHAPVWARKFTLHLARRWRD